jgi:hypothetical protein
VQLEDKLANKTHVFLHLSRYHQAARRERTTCCWSFE